MKLRISQMIEGEQSFHFDSRKDEWMSEVLTRVAKQGYRLTGALEAQLSITKLEPDYYLRGEISHAVEQPCARCAETFTLSVRYPFELAMAHLAEGKARKASLSEESDELDVIFFEGNDIEVTPILEEQFVLSIPYQSLCDANCRGVCQQCGQNLNSGVCTCKTTAPLNPFSVLEKLRS